MEFIVFVLIAIVAGIVNKARQQQKGRPQQFAWPKPDPGTSSGQASSQQGTPQQPGPGYPQAPPGFPPGPGFQQGVAGPGHPPPPGIQPGLTAPRFEQPSTAPYIVQNLPPQHLPHHRPPQHQLPASRDDLDAQVRTLMAANNEVGAVRLLCDEAEMGIIEAQKHARSLVAPAGTAAAGTQPTGTQPAADGGRGAGRVIGSAAAEPDPEEYVGSAAFATSTFDTGEDDDVWASGWTDTPAPDDRSDIDELWQTVRDSATPSAAGAPAADPAGGSGGQARNRS